MARQMQEEEWRIREQDEQDMLVAMLVAQQLDEEERARRRMSLAAAAGNGEWVRRPLEVVWCFEHHAHRKPHGYDTLLVSLAHVGHTCRIAAREVLVEGRRREEGGYASNRLPGPSRRIHCSPRHAAAMFQ